MAITLPHIEDANQTNYLPPQGEIQPFESEEEYETKLKEWKLPAKKAFWFKQKTHQRKVEIVGYQAYGEEDDHYTIVIKFQDGKLSCIHPAYLKEMQAGNFGKEAFDAAGQPNTAQIEEKQADEKTKEQAPTPPKTTATKTKTKKKEAAKKIQLPEDKVAFSAIVKQFALSYNHFTEDHDEVIVLDEVVIHQDDPLPIGLAWCSHSKTLKKQELAIGNKLSFNGKIVKKKLPKAQDDVDEEHKVEEAVPYKINNPSKIEKQ
ncbi:hypothetical protein [Cytobacillus sp. FSL R7-0696]|uniref:hypothetical protein n=1 Tax=Cytobacillus TaxID=2675230 RepID=UPI0030F73951